MRAAILLCLSTLSVLAGSPDPGDFLRMPPDPAGAVWAGACDAVLPQPVACLRNPGAVGFSGRAGLFAAHTFLSLERRLDAAGASVRLGPRGTLALAALQTEVDRIDGRDGDGRHTEYLTDTRNALSFVFALRLSPAVAVGLSIKSFFRTTAHETASGTAFDGGLALGPWNRLWAAVGFRNVGLMRPKGRPVGAYWPWSTSGTGEDLRLQKHDRIPPALSLAVASRHLPGKVVAGLELEKVEARPLSVSGGVRVPVDDRFALLAGRTPWGGALGAEFDVALGPASIRISYGWGRGPITRQAIHRVALFTQL